jgi:hypothetical protein
VTAALIIVFYVLDNLPGLLRTRGCSDLLVGCRLRSATSRFWCRSLEHLVLVSEDEETRSLDHLSFFPILPIACPFDITHLYITIHVLGR